MNTFLIVVVVVLAVAAIWQIVRVLELSAEVKADKQVNEVTDKDNKLQGLLMVGFLVFMFASFAYMVIAWDKYLLPKSASEHGVQIDQLMSISMWLIIAVFIITQPLLFWFAYKYRGRKGNKAEYIEHNNKLELAWTLAPAVVLTGLIIYGLSTWNAITGKSDEGAIEIELYAEQFAWTARYGGDDNTLARATTRLKEGANVLGIDTEDKAAADDIVVKELHLPVGKPVTFTFRSQDIIHSAYMPHFRLQMNCVPGRTTRFKFTPTITTAEMRQDKKVMNQVEMINNIRTEKGLPEDEMYEFDYVLLCNKICGSSHYNMQMKVIVETQEEYEAWLKEQPRFAEQ